MIDHSLKIFRIFKSHKKSLFRFIVRSSSLPRSETYNVARDAALMSGIPNHIPAITQIGAACSSGVTMQQGYNQVAHGCIDVALVSGVETFSYFPLFWPKKTRDFFYTYGPRIKSFSDFYKFSKHLKINSTKCIIDSTMVTFNFVGYHV